MSLDRNVRAPLTFGHKGPPAHFYSPCPQRNSIRTQPLGGAKHKWRSQAIVIEPFVPLANDRCPPGPVMASPLQPAPHHERRHRCRPVGSATGQAFRRSRDAAPSGARAKKRKNIVNDVDIRSGFTHHSGVRKSKSITLMCRSRDKQRSESPLVRRCSARVVFSCCVQAHRARPHPNVP
jgi:hypothetical protein